MCSICSHPTRLHEKFDPVFEGITVSRENSSNIVLMCGF